MKWKSLNSPGLISFTIHGLFYILDQLTYVLLAMREILKTNSQNGALERLRMTSPNTDRAIQVVVESLTLDRTIIVVRIVLKDLKLMHSCNVVGSRSGWEGGTADQLEELASGVLRSVTWSGLPGRQAYDEWSWYDRLDSITSRGKIWTTQYAGRGWELATYGFEKPIPG